MPEADIDAQVSAAVDAWLAWLPRWTPSLARTGGRVCRRCIGSPVIDAAQLREVPHKVQHALVSRVHAIVDDHVAAFTLAELPLLQSELDKSEAARRSAKTYRPEEGLGHEFEGLGVDPEPVPGEPYLFTLAGLADDGAGPPTQPTPVDTPLSAEAKQRLRAEISLADDRAAQVGRAACLALVQHRRRIAAGVGHIVTPQVDDLMKELGAGLTVPDSLDGSGL